VSIQKKSLINTLKSAKKANVVKDDVTVSSATASPVKMNPSLRATTKMSPVTKLGKKSAATVRLATKFNAVKF
jgi:hypothetical protein